MLKLHIIVAIATVLQTIVIQSCRLFKATKSAGYVLGMLGLELGILFVPAYSGISDWNYLWTASIALVVFMVDLLIREGELQLVIQRLRLHLLLLIKPLTRKFKSIIY